DLELRGTLLGHSAVPVLDLAFSPDGRVLVSDSMDATVRLWDVAVGEEVLTLRGPLKGGARQARFAPDGRTLAFWAGDGGEVSLHMLSTILPAGLDPEEYR